MSEWRECDSESHPEGGHWCGKDGSPGPDPSHVWIEGCQAMREAIARRIEDVSRTLGVQMVVVTADQIRETDLPFDAGRRYFLPE